MFQAKLRSGSASEADRSVSRLVQSSAHFVVDSAASAEVYVAPRRGAGVSHGSSQVAGSSTPFFVSSVARRSGSRQAEQAAAPSPRSSLPVEPVREVRTERAAVARRIDDLEARMRGWQPGQVHALEPTGAERTEEALLRERLAAVENRLADLSGASHREHVAASPRRHFADAQTSAMQQSFASSATVPPRHEWSSLQIATLQARQRGDLIEVNSRETDARESIEAREDAEFRDLATMLVDGAQRIEELAEMEDAERMNELQRQLRAHDALVARGEQHRVNLERSIVEDDGSPRSAARDSLQHRRLNAESHIEEAGERLHDRIDVSRPSSAFRGSDSSKSVRFVMTEEQERAAEETQVQIDGLVVQARRRRNKKELMQRLLGRPAVTGDEA